MIRILLFASLAFACTSRPVDRDAAPAPVTTQPAPPTGPSLYDLASPLSDENARQIGFDADRGHPTLVSMFYGSCTAACPVLVSTIGRVLEQLPAAKRDDVRVLLVSFDPARDTPARLRELVAAHHLDARWTLASARDDDARTLAAVLGIRYRKAPDGQFFHTSAIVLLDQNGRMVTRMDGLGDTSALVTALSP